MPPVISVIIPVYNAEKYIIEAVNSICNQTITNIEIIIIDDGSTDNSFTLLSTLAEKDSRIVLLSRENKGLVYTLNQAIDMAKADFIARMDADDISLSTRLEKQLKYLTKNTNVAVLGTGYQYMDKTGELGKTRHMFTDPEDIKASLYFGNPIAHPSVMVNYKLLGKDFIYIERYKTVEDLELWCRVLKKYEVANLAEVLFHYRILESSISGTNLTLQLKSAAKILAKYLPLKHCTNGIEVTKNLYSYSINEANYIQFFKACIKLNWHNLKYRTIKPTTLFKRTIIALLSATRKNLRR